MIVVTGGSGFIGSHLCRLLHKEGEEARIVDIAPPPAMTGAEFVRGSVLDAPRLQRLFAGADAVAHLAALVDVAASVADPVSDFQVNALGTLSVLEAARRAGVPKVVFASSAAVYGNPQELPVSEGHPTAPLSPYGASKLCAERMVLMCNSLYGMKNTALRLFNVYGRGQNPHNPYSGVIAKFAEALSSGGQPLIYGDGHQTRDFVHVADVARAFSLALSSDGCSSPMNIGSGKETSVLSLLQIMSSITGKRAEPQFLPARNGDIVRSVADVSFAREKLGYYPKVGLEEGLRELLSED